MRDLFSDRAKFYAAFRPGYPTSLAEHILLHTTGRKILWDCATGNGQAAQLLAPHFEKVIATDMSRDQLSNAFTGENIEYSVALAENSGIEDNTIDLVTVAQAYHWLDPVKFAKEVRRVTTPEATIAVWGYSLLQTEDETLNQEIYKFYADTIGPFWDPERILVEQKYQAIAFPYMELPSYESQMVYSWTPAHLEGYLSSWSAVKKYKDAHEEDPVRPFMASITRMLPHEFKVMFPLFMRLGKVHRQNNLA